MKEHNKRFQREFFAVVIACCLGAFLVAKYSLNQNVPTSFWIAMAIISIATFYIHKILLDANQHKRPQVFVNYFMGALTVKLLLSAMLLLVVGLLDRANLKFTAVAFFIAYALLTAVELKNLLPLVRNSDR